MSAVIGRRVRLIMPVGLEKRVLEDMDDLAAWANASDASGPRLFVAPGEVFTEIEAINVLTGAEAALLAAGGVYGAEGADWLGVRGTKEEEEAAAALIRSVRTSEVSTVTPMPMSARCSGHLRPSLNAPAAPSSSSCI